MLVKKMSGKSLIWLQIAALVLTSISVFWASTEQSAAGMVTPRKMDMESSASGATGVTYSWTFTVPSVASSTRTMEFLFCANSPIISMSCTATAGTDVPDIDIDNDNAEADDQTLSTSGLTGTWTIDDTQSTATKLAITRATAAEDLNGATVTVSINNVTNQATTNTSFYSRIRMYSDTGYSTEIHNGGIAASTAAQITLSGKVQETLVFCIYISGGSCGTPGAVSTQQIGDSDGVLDSSTSYVNAEGVMSMRTNASSGAVVNMIGTTLCRDSSGTNCTNTGAHADTITPMGSQGAGGGSATTRTAGTEQFGMCIMDNTTLDATAPYDDDTGCTGITSGSYTGSANFSFYTNASEGTQALYGDEIASTGGGPMDTQTATLVFLANIAITTEPGLYDTVLTFVGTGTF